MTIVVIKEFADPNDFSKRYKVGDELTGLDEQRIAYYTSLGIIEVEQELEQDTDKELPESDSSDSSDASDNWKVVVNQVKAMTDVNELLELYCKEGERKTPRKSVQTAIEERLKLLEAQEKQ